MAKNEGKIQADGFAPATADDNLWEAAGEAAVSTEADSWEDQWDAETKGEPAESEQEPEDRDDTEAVEAEATEEDPIEEVDEGDDGQSVEEWSGSPDELPTAIVHEGKTYDLSKTYKSMQAGYTKKMQEIADREREREREYAATIANANKFIESQQEQQRAVAMRAPEKPAEGSTQAEWDTYNDRRVEWLIAKQRQDDIDAGRLHSPEQVQQQNIQAQHEANSLKISNALNQQEGYTQEVAKEMYRMIKEDPYWSTQTDETPEAAIALFNIVKTNMDAAGLKAAAAENETQNVRKKAGASRNTVSRSKSSKPVGAADKFKNMGFDEAGQAAIDELYPG